MIRHPTLADDAALVETLRLAVPLRMAELLAMPPEHRSATGRGWMTDAARRVGEAGDLLQFVTPRQREGRADLRVANVFEHLAKGLAALAVLYGEARIAGLTWTCPRGAA